MFNSETLYSVLKLHCKESREGIFSRQCEVRTKGEYCVRLSRTSESEETAQKQELIELVC